MKCESLRIMIESAVCIEYLCVQKMFYKQFSGNMPPAWQHPKSPQKEALNIAEAPKTATSAVLKASLGEDIPSEGG